MTPTRPLRVLIAFGRARRAVQLQEVGRLTQRLMTLLHSDLRIEDQPQSGLASPAAADSAMVGAGDSPAVDRGDAKGAPGGGFLERIAVEARGQVRVVPVNQVDYITANGPYAELHVADKRYLIRERMQTLEERLDSARFLRIHRSAIVRIDAIEILLREPGGDYAVRLRGGPELPVGRSRRDDVEQRLGMAC